MLFSQIDKHINQKNLRSAHWDYIENTFTQSLAENNTRLFWKYVKECGADNIGVSPIREGEDLYSSSKD